MPTEGRYGNPDSYDDRVDQEESKDDEEELVVFDGLESEPPRN